MARWLWIAMVIIALFTFIFLLFDGLDYYTTPYSERPRHEDYREFRPAGSRGLAYGYIGSAMMILMLLYSVRKRSRLLGRLLKLRSWLNFHIFLGAFGPLLILLHTSFKVQGLVAVAFWSMVAVALSGYLGRFLYQQIPRNLEGDELTLAELEETQNKSNLALAQQLGLSRAQLQVLDDLNPGRISESTGIIRLLIGLLLADIQKPFLRSKIRRRLRTTGAEAQANINEIVNLAIRRLALQRRVIALDRVQRIFHYWHVIHKPFAIIMYLIMSVHIGIAIWTGYTWIF